MVRSKVELFDVSSVADIAAEASRQLDQAENARNKCTKVKGDLNQIMKVVMAIAKQAIYKLAERAMGMGDPDLASREKILTLVRERDALQKEIKQLRGKPSSGPSLIEAGSAVRDGNASGSDCGDVLVT